MTEQTLSTSLPASTKTSFGEQFDWWIIRAVVQREVRDSMRDWRIVIPILLLTLVFPYIMQIGAGIVFEFLEGYDATVIAERFTPFGLLAVGFFPMSFSLVIALETFVGERERDSLEALFATPASDVELYLGKLVAALLLPLFASYVGIGIYAILLSWGGQWSITLSTFVQILALTTTEGVVMVAAAVIVSSHTTSVRAANLLASFIIVPIAILLQIESVAIFWGENEVLWWIVLGLLVLVVALLRAGLNTFNRESILAREIDHLNVERAAQLMWAFFRTPPDDVRAIRQTPEKAPRFSLLRFYRHDLVRLLYRERLAIYLSLVVLFAASALGWSLADMWQLPAGIFDFSDINREMLQSQLTAGSTQLDILPQFSPLAIFIHNARTLIIGAILSILSFGVAALLILALPLAAVGFLAGNVAAAGQSVPKFLAAFILPHGVVELTGVVLATAFAVRVGAMLMGPPRGLSAGEGVLLAAADFARIFLLVVIPLLAVAAILEACVTPQVIFWLYL